VEGHKRKTLYGKTRKEVQEKLRVALHEQKQGMLATGPQQTLKQYLEQWLEEVHRPTLRLSSYDRYRSLLNNHILPSLGHIQVNKLTVQQVQALYARKVNEGLSAKTIQNIHGLLHKALDNAVKWGLVSRNVCSVVSTPRLIRHEIHPLTKEQAQLLLEKAHGQGLEAILSLALVTGMRRGELLALRWQDIDFEAMSLHVSRTVNHLGSYGYVENEPKTARSRRKIMVPQFVIEVLHEHKARQAEARLKAGSKWKEQDLVFPNTSGGFIYPDVLLNQFRKLLKNAGLPHMRFHDLRHSAATILLSMGVHVKVVQELLGHSAITMTMDVYSHVLPSMQQEAMGKLNDLYRQGDGTKMIGESDVGGDNEAK